jgi:hypothetical protein
MSSKVNSPWRFPQHYSFRSHTLHPHGTRTANKKELVDDLMVKAKQIEYLIQSLPIPEPEEVQVRARAGPHMAGV